MRAFPALIPLAALVVVLCLLHGGWSCGVDAPFHVQSWIDASQQLRHGVVYPRWTFDAAYNAGEPRFTFYPPLSWELGALLTLLLPISVVPQVFVWIVLSVAGWCMYRAVSPWSTPAVSSLAACVYLANPFMLFTVVTRAGYGELFAAAWGPLLLAALLAERPSAWRVGVPLGLIWLSNVPAAVLAMYLVALVGCLRLVLALFDRHGRPSEAAAAALGVALGAVRGYVAGLALAAVFLVPAVRERHWIRMADAYAPGMRPYDNLLPLHGLERLPDLFLIRVGHIAFAMALATFALLGLAWVRNRTLASGLNRWLTLPLLALSATLTFLTLAPSAWLWKHLPLLWVAQFPWRVLFLLGCCLGFALAAGLRGARLPSMAAGALAVAYVALLALWLGAAFRHRCDASERPTAILASLERHHTPEPTDEYVAATADAEFMRPDNPPFWLTQDPRSFAAGTTPNRTGTDPEASMPAVPDGAALQATPLHFWVDTAAGGFLVVNLQNFPKWRVRLNGTAMPDLLPRPDGLIALRVPAGRSQIDIRWQRTWDEVIGWLVSLTTLVWLLLARVRSGSRRRSVPRSRELMVAQS